MASKTQFEVLGFGLGLKSQVLGRGLEASSPQKCPVLSSKTVLFFDWLKMGQSHEQCCFVLEHAGELAEKNFWRPTFEKKLQICGRRPLFFFENTYVMCPWSLASNIPVLGLKRVCPWLQYKYHTGIPLNCDTCPHFLRGKSRAFF